MTRIIKVVVFDRRHIGDLEKHYETTFKYKHATRLTFQAIPECVKSTEQLTDFLSDAEIIIMSAESREFGLAARISGTTKWIQWTWAGVEPLAFGPYKDKLNDCVVTRAAGVYGQSVSEYVVGAIITLEKSFPKYFKQQMERKWERITRFRDLTCLSIGILGLGDIGKSIAKSCSLLGMTVYGLKKTVAECQHVTKVFGMNELSELLKCSDYICNVLPSTPETKEILSEEMLKLCAQRKGMFINVGRGDVVDENVLIKALENGWLSGAFLDVFAKEPLDKSSPLWSMENVVITPHIGGKTSGEIVSKSFFKNLDKYLNNDTLDQWFPTFFSSRPTFIAIFFVRPTMIRLNE